MHCTLFHSNFKSEILLNGIFKKNLGCEFSHVKFQDVHPYNLIVKMGEKHLQSPSNGWSLQKQKSCIYISYMYLCQIYFQTNWFNIHKDAIDMSWKNNWVINCSILPHTNNNSSSSKWNTKSGVQSNMVQCQLI